MTILRVDEERINHIKKLGKGIYNSPIVIKDTLYKSGYDMVKNMIKHYHEVSLHYIKEELVDKYGFASAYLNNQVSEERLPVSFANPTTDKTLFNKPTRIEASNEQELEFNIERGVKFNCIVFWGQDGAVKTLQLIEEQGMEEDRDWVMIYPPGHMKVVVYCRRIS